MKVSAFLGSLGLHLAAGAALVLLAHGALEPRPRPVVVTLRHLTPQPQAPAAPLVPRSLSGATPRPEPAALPLAPPQAPAAAPAASFDPEPAPQSEAPSPTAPGVAAPREAVQTQPGAAAPPAAAPSVVPPRVVSYTKPAYPPRLRNLGVEGSVVLEIAVAADGTPQSVTVVRSSGYPEMDSRAVEALRRARYSPQTEGDAPVAGVLSLLVRYTLE